MEDYSDFVERLFRQEAALRSLIPGDYSDVEAVLRIRQADDDVILGSIPAAEPPFVNLVRAGLYYRFDALDDAAGAVGETEGETADYWRGMIRRRQGDFENARVWFRRAGEHPVARKLHARVSRYCPVMAKQQTWDPYLFVYLCEQYRFGDHEDETQLLRMQRDEFDFLFDYTWRQVFHL